MHTNNGSKVGNKGQVSYLLLCHHYKATHEQFVMPGKSTTKTEDKGLRTVVVQPTNVELTSPNIENMFKMHFMSCRKFTFLKFSAPW